MTRTIKYSKKIVNANTVYTEMHPTDRTWLLSRVLDVATGYANDLITTEYLNKKNKHISKGRNGMNTPKEYLNGVFSNLGSNTHDFSVIQLKDIETIFTAINDIIEQMTIVLPSSVDNWADFQSVTFLDINKQETKLEPEVNAIEEAIEQFQKTHISDLFEITVTVRSKQ